jgi:hypothetical protein
MAFTPLTKTNSCPRIREARSHRRFRGLNGEPLRWTPPPVLPCYRIGADLETAGNESYAARYNISISYRSFFLSGGCQRVLSLL